MSLNVDTTKAQPAPSEIPQSDRSVTASAVGSAKTASAASSPTTQSSLANSGTRGGDSAAVSAFLSDHPEQKDSLQSAAFAAGNYSLFHRLSQPDSTAGSTPSVVSASAARSEPADNPTPAPKPPENPPAKTKPNLTSAEREVGFFVRHPAIATDIGQFVKGSTNISTDAVRFATLGPPATKRTTLDNTRTEGSQVNAFRHTLWQATIAGKYGNDIAAQVGNAHEENPLVDLNQTSFPSLAAADQVIDLKNNQIGRAIAAQNPGASMKDLAGKVLDTFRSEGLYTASGPKPDGSFTIARNKISDAQYNEMKGLIAGVNDNGFTPTQQAAKDKQDLQDAIDRSTFTGP